MLDADDQLQEKQLWFVILSLSRIQRREMWTNVKTGQRGKDCTGEILLKEIMDMLK